MKVLPDRPSRRFFMGLLLFVILLTVALIAYCSNTKGSRGTSETSETPAMQDTPSTAETTSSVIPVVEGNAGKAVVIVAGNARWTIHQAAEQLVHYIKKATDVELMILTPEQLQLNKDMYKGWTRLYVGSIAPHHEDIEDELEGLDEDGFVIQAASNSITIMGSSEWGTEFAVYEFLERYVGVRWLMPGVNGEDVPRHEALAVSKEMIKMEPAFMSRSIGMTSTPENDAWLRHNRVRSRVYLNHNLSTLFPVEKYPQYYLHGSGQPCFASPGIVEEAIRNINLYFSRNPRETSYSLGINDNFGFCEANPDHPDYPNQLNSLGVLHMSDIYFGWVKEVAEGVMAKHPDKFITAYAYNMLYDPPAGIQLPENVIVYITDERMKWSDPVIGDEARKLSEQWMQAASGVGFYEYLYGKPYKLPRTYFHQMASNYRYAQEIGVVAHVAELYPNFGEGPKLWLSAKLQWDPDQDVDALLAEWYERAVGPDAALPLADYFAHWEHFWQNRIFDTGWFAGWAHSDPRYHFTPYFDDRYLLAVTEEEMAASRRYLEETAAKAKTAEQKERARYLLSNFAYYEAYALGYPREESMEPPVHELEAIAMFENLLKKLTFTEKRLDVIRQFQENRDLPQTMSPLYERWETPYANASANEWMELVKWLDNASSGEEVRRHVMEWIESTPASYSRYFAKLLLAIADRSSAVNHNPSFEEDESSSAWWYWVTDSPSKEMHRSDKAAWSGNYSLYAKGMHIAGPVQTFAIQPGYHGITAYYYSPTESSGEGTIQLSMTLMNDQMQAVGSYSSTVRRLADTAGEWSVIEWLGEIPEQMNGSAVSHVRIIISMVGFASQQEVYIDDVHVYNLESTTTD